jgi:hypothetical protein
VLGNSTMRFALPLAGAPGAGSSIRLSGQSETGAINATVLPK